MTGKKKDSIGKPNTEINSFVCYLGFIANYYFTIGHFVINTQRHLAQIGYFNWVTKLKKHIPEAL